MLYPDERHDANKYAMHIPGKASLYYVVTGRDAR